jgi:hypothetical protein
MQLEPPGHLGDLGTARRIAIVEVQELTLLWETAWLAGYRHEQDGKAIHLATQHHLETGCTYDCITNA